MSSTNWNDLVHCQTRWIYPQVSNVKDSLWVSTDYDYGEKGMVEFCPKTNKIIQIVKYPNNIKPYGQSVCQHENNIYIVDGNNSQIILFNPFTKQFIVKNKLPKLGYSTCCVQFNNYIHIFNGSTNKKHFIYSIKDNTIKSLNDSITTQNIQSVCILYYNQRIIRFGGYNCDTKKCMNTVFIGSPMRGNNFNIKWTQNINYKLPIGIYKCGFVLYKNCIILFGGLTDGGQYLDSIYLLKLNDSNNQWVKLGHIKCPLKSSYIAVFDSSQTYVHLFTSFYKQLRSKHYSIPISKIVRNIEIENKEMENKCEQCDVLREQINIIKSEKNSLQSLVDQLLTKQNTMPQEINTSETIVNKYKKQILELKETAKRNAQILQSAQFELQKQITQKEIMLNNYNQQIYELINQWTTTPGDIESTEGMPNNQSTDIASIIEQLQITMNHNSYDIRKEILENKTSIMQINDVQQGMKYDLSETKENILECITSLNKEILNMKQILDERDIAMNKINAQMIQTHSKTPETQREIYELCQKDKYNELFIVKISQKISMMFFDAKVILSDFIRHQMATDSTILKGAKGVTWIAEKLAKDIPFASAVIGLVKAGVCAGYNKGVLKVFAKNVEEFEIFIGGDGSSFAVEFALHITKLNADFIQYIRKFHQNDNKKISKDIDKESKEFAKNLIKMISTGYGLKIYKECWMHNESYCNILAYLTMYHPSKATTHEEYQREKLKQNHVKRFVLDRSEKIKCVIQPYLNEFDSPGLVKTVMNNMKHKIKSILKP